MKGAIAKADGSLQKRFQKQLYSGQFVNPANPAAHRNHRSRDLERYRRKVDVVIAGVGTGGTLSGIGDYQK